MFYSTTSCQNSEKLQKGVFKGVHLGNVKVVISDRKLVEQTSLSANNEIVANQTYFTPEILASNDYYAFGMLQPDRHAVNGKGSSRGYNGMEKDDELKGKGNSYTTEFRQYDPRIGRWLNIDPLMSEYLSFSPYNFCLNSVLSFNDKKGDRPLPVQDTYKGRKWTIASGFGHRDVKSNAKASKFHRGIDFNNGGGFDDYGAPVLATHDGIFLLSTITLVEQVEDMFESLPLMVVLQRSIYIYQILVLWMDRKLKKVNRLVH